jgi:hypothetical protein
MLTMIMNTKTTMKKHNLYSMLIHHYFFSVIFYFLFSQSDETFEVWISDRTFLHITESIFLSVFCFSLLFPSQPSMTA